MTGAADGLLQRDGGTLPPDAEATLRALRELSDGRGVLRRLRAGDDEEFKQLTEKQTPALAQEEAVRILNSRSLGEFRKNLTGLAHAVLVLRCTQWQSRSAGAPHTAAGKPRAGQRVGAPPANGKPPAGHTPGHWKTPRRIGSIEVSGRGGRTPPQHRAPLPEFPFTPQEHHMQHGHAPDRDDFNARHPGLPPPARHRYHRRH
ncbi:hypothetical protein ACFQ7B_36870 [Streptomyces erythrochromogenes]|uniref:hypothetical protein n=1 Tax=Streptomyces erythrochromogenes TaxID=285574 RepID=UPI003697C3F3